MATFYTKVQVDEQAGVIGQRIRKVTTDLSAYIDTKVLTEEERTKLSGLESSKYLGTYLTAEAIPTEGATPGNYADVDAGVDAKVERWIYDADSEVFVKSFSEVGGETAASIKTKYEENPNTNAFTDTDKTKLDTLVLTENNFTNTLKAKLEGLSQTGGAFTPELQAKLEGLNQTENSFTNAEKVKLAGLVLTENSFTTAEKNKLESLVLTENSFTTAEKTKLANLTQVDVTPATDTVSFVDALDAALVTTPPL
jgi:hypothetical protein